MSADDYAYSESIDNGIIALIQQQRLTATSCLVMSPRWPKAAERLDLQIRKLADIGLHLDFTEYGAGICYQLPMLIGRSLTRTLSSNGINRSINIQLDHFEDSLNMAPDYIDGHQHVHQLPQIRDALLEIVQRRYAGRLPWLRIANPPWEDGIKAGIIGYLGAAALNKSARKAGVPHTENLLGVYAFDLDVNGFQKKLTSWLNTAKSGTTTGISALMCHPAMPTQSEINLLDDPIHAARLVEYQVLSGADFTNQLLTHEVTLSRGNILQASHV